MQIRVRDEIRVESLALPETAERGEQVWLDSGEISIDGRPATFNPFRQKFQRHAIADRTDQDSLAPHAFLRVEDAKCGNAVPRAYVFSICKGEPRFGQMLELHVANSSPIAATASL